MNEAGIRIGEKNLRMDGTDTERELKTDLLICELQTGSRSKFRKGVNCGAEAARRDVPHIEKCSPIRSTNLRYSSCFDDERSRPIEKIVRMIGLISPLETAHFM